MKSPEIKLGGLYHFRHVDGDEVVAFCRKSDQQFGLLVPVAPKIPMKGVWLETIASTESYRVGQLMWPDWGYVEQFEELTVKSLPLYISWPHNRNLIDLLKGDNK